MRRGCSGAASGRLGGFARNDFLQKSRSLVDLLQSFDNGSGINRYGASLFFRVSIIPNQRLDISIEYDPDKFTCAIDDRAAAAAADDVDFTYEIEPNTQIELAFALHPALRDIERRLIFALCAALEKPADL